MPDSLTRTTLAVAVVVLAVAPSARAQDATVSARIVDVDGIAMRVAVAGLEGRRAGQPVVVLEAGAGESGIESWAPVFDDLARIAPVVAYDRRGIGGSQPGATAPTLRRGAGDLRRLLDALDVAPPFVLVGHSWGGLPARAFFDRSPNEVAGLVFLDAIHPGPTREERAARVPPDQRAAILAPPVMPPIPAETPPGVRAEYELITSEMVNDYPEARSLRLPDGVPVVVVLAAPPGRVESFDGQIGVGADDLAGLALRSPNGLFVAAGHVGHFVHHDDPGMVVRLVEHVLTHTGQPTR